MTAREFPQWFKSRFTHTSSFASGITFMIFDCIGVMLCVGAGFFTVNAVDRTLIVFRDFVHYWVYLPAFAAAFFAARLYPGIMLQPAEEVRRFSLTSFFCFTGIALSIAVETDDRNALSVALLLAVPFATFILPLIREAVRHAVSFSRWWGIPVVVYSSSRDKQLVVARLLKKPTLGYKPAAIIADDTAFYSEYRGIPVFPYSAEIEQRIHECKITTAIVVERNSITQKGPHNLLLSAYRYIITIPFQQGLKSVSLSVRDFGGVLGFSAANRLTRPINLVIKRLIDLALLLLSAPLVLPLIGLLALLVKWTSPGPVFYGHPRVGKNGKPLKCWKFRSMCKDADKKLDALLAQNPKMREQWERERKFVDDPRVTPFGKFIRKTSIDELPQFWNILAGEMSFIGPRPVTKGELVKYGSQADYILSVTPGLSGMWQTSGRSDTEYEERITLDTYYIQNWSIWLDIWLIIKTVWVVFKRKGAY